MQINIVAAPTNFAATPGTVTVTPGTEAVINKGAHGLPAGTPVKITSSGTMPTGIVSGKVYYVSAKDLAAGTFKLQKAPTGQDMVGATDAGTGTITCTMQWEVMRIDVQKCEVVSLEVTNNGANALGSFDIVGLLSENGNEEVLLTAAGDYTGPVFPCLKASASPIALAAGANAWMFLDVRGITTLIARAKATIANGSVTIRGSAKEMTTV